MNDWLRRSFRTAISLLTEKESQPLMAQPFAGIKGMHS